MTNTELEKLKYPIGQFQGYEMPSPEVIARDIEVISAFPGKLKKEVSHLTEEQLETPYRPGGWTIRQVAHHCADSHMNALARFKLALTEENPTIKPYLEDRWAELTDSKSMPIEPGLLLLEGLHQRWVAILKAMTEPDYQKTFFHPEHNKEFRLGELISHYAWHCAHHLAHVTELKKRKGWTK